MNSFLSNEVAQQHIGDLRREARAGHVPEEPGELAEEDCLTVRAATPRDSDGPLSICTVERLLVLVNCTRPSGSVSIMR